MDVRTFIRNDRGSQFIENGLWIALVVLTLAGAGYGLASTIKGKYTSIDNSVKNVNVPNITP